MCEFFKTFQEEKFTESVKKVSFNYIYVFLQLMCFSSLIKRLVDVQVRFFFKVHFRCLKKKKAWHQNTHHSCCILLGISSYTALSP